MIKIQLELIASSKVVQAKLGLSFYCMMASLMKFMQSDISIMAKIFF